jgi:NADH-quinone oxidoreductase subunit H
MNFWSDPLNFIAEWLRSVLLGWGLGGDLVQFLFFLVGGFMLAAVTMFFALFLIWLERKLGARVQDRLGPNRLGPWGIFQTVADMLKIFIKEYITPVGADIVPYNLAPILMVGGVLMVWGVIPFASTIYGANLNVGMLYVVAVGAISTLGIIMAGWGSNNKYAMLASFRMVAQLISYEVPMLLVMLLPVLFSGSMALNDVVKAQDMWYIVLAPLAALIFFITLVAETGRAPFDLLEAESEIVAGFNIEYSGLKFGMFFVGEFLHGFTISLLFATLFLGGWRGPGAVEIPILGFFYLIAKTSVVYLITLMMRFGLPRFRIDQMMDLNWKVLTPLAFGLLIGTAIVDKILPQDQMLLRVVGLLALNGALWAVAELGLRRYRRRSEPAMVGKPRPLARPDNLK